MEQIRHSRSSRLQASLSGSSSGCPNKEPKEKGRPPATGHECVWSSVKVTFSHTTAAGTGRGRDQKWRCGHTTRTRVASHFRHTAKKGFCISYMLQLPTLIARHCSDCLRIERKRLPFPSCSLVRCPVSCCVGAGSCARCHPGDGNYKLLFHR